MTTTEMIFDAGLFLAFYAFGLCSGLFVAWVEDRTRNQTQ